MLKKMSYGFAIILAFSFFTVANAQNKESEKDKTEMQQMNHKDDQKMDEKSDVKPWNKVCPVRGSEVNPEVTLVEYNGKSYGFCCPGCDSKFENNPEKYSKNLSEDGKTFIGKK